MLILPTSTEVAPLHHNRRIDRWAAGILVFAAAVWLAAYHGVLGLDPGLVSDVVQTSTSLVAAGLLWWSAGGPRPLIGAQTRVAAASMVVWSATDLAWTIASRSGVEGVDWLNAGYFAATVGFAIAVWRAALSGDQVRATHSLRLARSSIDAALIAAGIMLWWTITVWEPLYAARHTLIVVSLTLADAAFLAGALLWWSNKEQAGRAGPGIVVAAATILLGTDALYGRELVEYRAGGLLDVGWCLLSMLLGFAALRSMQSKVMNETIRRRARWMQPVLPVLIALGTFGLSVASGGPDVDGAVLTLQLVLLGVLAGRTMLQLAEHHRLTDRLNRVAEALAHRADHDDLTGLLDRIAFVDLAAAVIDDRRADGQDLALLWVDLDGFKKINDVLGHGTGDGVLIAIADRLRSCCGPDDIVARLGGDEFVILRPIADGHVDGWAERIRNALGAPIDVRGTRIRVTSSIGLLHGPHVPNDVDALLREADLAMYESKRAGRNRVEHYDPSLALDAQVRRATANLIGDALVDDRILAYYQPVVSLDDGRAVGAEALIRMRDDNGHLVGPDEFLAIAEATGAMPELTSHMLWQACADFAAHPDLGWVSVNLSTSDIADPRLTDVVADVLEHTGLDPARLVLEISEQTVPQPYAVRAITRLADLGVGIALDDFGSGRSSLGQLRDLPIRMLKIDRSVVVGAEGRGGNEAALLRVVVELAASAGVIPVAEGIESTAVADTCRRAGVSLGQGWLWSPAVPLRAMLAETSDHIVETDPAPIAQG